MTSPGQLVHSRARIEQRYAMFPLAGYPVSRLPAWTGAEIRVLTAPAMGANFVQHHVTLATDGGGRRKADGRIESFLFLLAGHANLFLDDGSAKQALVAGSFVFVPSTSSFEITAIEPTTVLLIQKVYEPAPGIAVPRPIIGNEKNIPADVWMNNPSTRLQLLIPDDLQYDLAMNIFTFDPGHGLPFVETHVMEHGLLMLQGNGRYYLAGDWMDVEKDDFIWMGPYCPQCYCASGPTATRYIYYKNVNREIPI